MNLVFQNVLKNLESLKKPGVKKRMEFLEKGLECLSQTWNFINASGAF